MPNIKSQIKRDKQNKKRTEKNQSLKSKVKTLNKRLEASVVEKNTDEAKENLNQFFKTLDKAEKSGIVHKNFVANKKSKASKLLNTLKKEKE